MENCRLCDSDISSGTSKVKRNGKAAVKVTGVLKGLLLEGHTVGNLGIPILSEESVCLSKMLPDLS